MTNQLYSPYKIFHFKEKLDSLSQSDSKIMAPIHVRVKPTNRCNHRCSYCAYTADGLQLGSDMKVGDMIPKEKMFEIIDDFEQIGVKAITFSGGGEPFTYPFFVETIKRLASSSIQFASLTNGSLLNGEIAELFAHHATWLRVSIDGWDDESYSKYRGVKKGEFSKVIENVRQFKALNGKCFLGVSLNVDKTNASHVFDIIGLFNSLKVDSIKVSGCVISNDGAENNLYHKDHFDQVKNQIRDAKTRWPDFNIHDTFHSLADRFSKPYTWCPYLQILPVIGADQNIYPCQDKAYNLEQGLVGSIKNQRFKDFWFSNKEQFFKINPSIVCNHHCVANSKNTCIHDYLSVDPNHLAFV